MSAGLKEEIQNYTDQARRRYESLSDSERWVVNGVGLLILVTLVFLLLIQPAMHSVSSAKTRLAGQEHLLQWVRDNESVARQAASSGAPKVKSNQPIQTIITTTAGPLGVTVKRYENESDSKLRVWLEKVPFDKMVRWLDQLQTRFGIQIVNISIDAEKDPGLVTAKLVLQS